MVNQYVLFLLLNGNECIRLYSYIHNDEISIHLWPMNVWYMYMSLSRMTSPCRLIRLTIIIIFLISTHALNNNNKVGCEDVYSFCESQTSYKYITCMSLIAALTIWIFIIVFRTRRTFLICAVSLPHHNLLTFQVQVFTLNCYKSSTFQYIHT